MSTSMLNQTYAIPVATVPEFTVTVEEARHMVLVRLVGHAQAMGANAVVSMRFDSTEMGEGGLAEIVAYGTAVVVEV